MTSSIRVLTSQLGHRYDRALYAPLADRIVHVGFPDSFPDREADLLAALEGVYGNDAEDLSRCLAELDLATLNERADAMRALQDEYAWERSADATFAMFEELLNRT